MRTQARLALLILVVGSSWGWGQEGPTRSHEDIERRAQEIVRERKQKLEAMARQPTSLNDGESVNPEILKPILDNSFGLRFEERDAYFRILELARQTPLADQQEYALDFREARRRSDPRFSKLKPELFSVFRDTYRNPDIFRGRPITVHGVMRKLTKFDPGENNRGIEDVYEGWVYSDDCRSLVDTKKTNEDGSPIYEEIVIPTVVIFQGKPDGLKVGGDLTEEVRLTGYFFKLYRYDSEETIGRAPLLLAGAVEWKKRAEAWKPPTLGAEVYLLITLVFVILGFVWWQGNRREMASAIHPAEADFTHFPPVELPVKDAATKIGSKLTEPDDA